MSAVSGFCEKCNKFRKRHCDGNRNTCMSILFDTIETLQQENEQLRRKGDFMLSTGPGHYVTTNKILAISGRNPNGHLSNPLSRQIQDAWATGKVIDHTGGRATNSVIHLEGGYLVLSHVRVETLAKRVDVAKADIKRREKHGD